MTTNSHLIPSVKISPSIPRKTAKTWAARKSFRRLAKCSRRRRRSSRDFHRSRRTCRLVRVNELVGWLNKNARPKASRFLLFSSHCRRTSLRAHVSTSRQRQFLQSATRTTHHVARRDRDADLHAGRHARQRESGQSRRTAPAQSANYFGQYLSPFRSARRRCRAAFWRT